MNTKKLKRQIEILALVERNPKKYSIADLCSEFGVEVATIQRDLRELRSYGSHIHSTKNKLSLLQSLRLTDYNELLGLYLSLSTGAVGFPKSIPIVTKKLKEKSLHTFVTLVRAIERSEVVEMDYVRVGETTPNTRRVEPYHLIPTTKDWRLIARSDGIFKQFFVDNIRRVATTGNRYKKEDFDLRKFFLSAWETFRLDEPTTVRLLFSKDVASIVKDRIWSETQEVDEQKNGAVLITIQVGGIEEIVGWVMGWGKEVEVMEPEELRQLTTQRAREVVAKHEHRAAGKSKSS